MALVMLPCDLPWWTSVQRHLKHLLLASNTDKLTTGMLKIHDMCNIGLDPEEDTKDPELMKGFAEFIDKELSPEERQHFFDSTLPSMVHRALHLKRWKPAKGLMFSLQQQSDVTDLEWRFSSSLLAHAFFSTFPKRTIKTHPTLQDFNFTHFFKHLNKKSQHAKLRSILHYFDWLDNHEGEGNMTISRQVMTSKQWLTIEDWTECSLPLCRLALRHEGRAERCDVPEDAVRICFASAKLGGDVLADGDSQECLSMCSMPEMLAAMLSVEALEDNEILKIEGARVFSRFTDARNKGKVELLDEPKQVTVCCMDAEDYSRLPLGQWEEDNILRELNKCLLAFQQRPARPPAVPVTDAQHQRRLSPIGETGIVPELASEPVKVTIRRESSTSASLQSFTSRSPSPHAYTAATLNLNDPSIELMRNKAWLTTPTTDQEQILNGRRGRFIVLGSSGELLPVTREGVSNTHTRGDNDSIEACDSLYSSCNSSEDEDDDDDDIYHSANGSFDEGSEDEGRGASGRPSSSTHPGGGVSGVGRYGTQLSTEARRLSFAGRLKQALRREAEESCGTATTTTGDWSTDSSSYAVGISISGAGVGDDDIRVKRGGSVGFVLAEDQPHRHLKRRETGNSSKYSFSTDYSSELEEVYEQFSQWLDDPLPESSDQRPRELDSRDMAVIRFAGSLLKRTLSESFAGTPLTEGCAHAVLSEEHPPLAVTSPHKLVLTARSLSLELAKHKHRLAAQLKDERDNKPDLISEESEDSSQITVINNSTPHANEPQTNLDFYETESILVKRPKTILENETKIVERYRESKTIPEFGKKNVNCFSDDFGETSVNKLTRSTSAIQTEGTHRLQRSKSVLDVPVPINGLRRSDSCRSIHRQSKNLKRRKKKLNWIIGMVTEVIEETVPVTLRIQKPKLSQLASKVYLGSALSAVVSGNWGCGTRGGGDAQLKLVLQWLAASVAGAPALIYYTNANPKLFKLDTLVRVLVDRKWTVGELARASLRFAHQTLHEPYAIPDHHSLFEELIGIDKSSDDCC